MMHLLRADLTARAAGCDTTCGLLPEISIVLDDRLRAASPETFHFLSGRRSHGVATRCSTAILGNLLSSYRRPGPWYALFVRQPEQSSIWRSNFGPGPRHRNLLHRLLHVARPACADCISCFLSPTWARVWCLCLGWCALCTTGAAMMPCSVWASK